MSHGSKKPAQTAARDRVPDARTVNAGLDRLLNHRSNDIFSNSQHPEPNIPILLVEDQAMMRKAFKRILEPSHLFSIQESQSPKDAIEYLRNHAIDLVILDLHLNRGSGLEVLNYIRSRPVANDIPIVFVTGEASRDDIVLAIELGVDDYLIKPFEPQDLILKIKQVLGRYIEPPEHLKKMRAAEADLIRGQVGDAHRALVELLKENPEHPRVLVGLAQAESRLGQTESAKKLLERTIRISDMCFPAYALMADILVQEGKRNEAIEFMLRELSLNGKRVGRRIQLAHLYFELHDYRSGLEQMRLALIDFPNDETLLLKTAQLQMESGDYEKALHYFMKTRRNVPCSSMALKGISEVCLKLGNPKKALQVFTDFLNQKPNQIDLLLARAQMYESIDQSAEALKDIEACLAIEPDQAESLTVKGRLLKKLGHEVPTRAVWAALSRIDPSTENMFQIGFINFSAGDFSQAALYFERALLVEPAHEKSLLHLVYSYKKLEQFGKAKAVCQKALALLPRAAEFKAQLDELNSAQSTTRKGKSGSLNRAS
jgi:DNA-binding response OmpR family regulator